MSESLKLSATSRMTVGIALIVAAAATATACSNNGGGAGHATPSGSRPLSTVPSALTSPTSTLAAPAWTRIDPASPFDQAFVDDVRNGETWRLTPNPRDAPDAPNVWVRSWSPSGEALVTVNAHTGLRSTTAVYAGVPGQSLRHLLDVNHWITSSKWSPDGKTVALGSASTGLAQNPEEFAVLVDAASGAVVSDLSRFGASVDGWSTDGRYLALSSGRAAIPRVRIWDRETGTAILVATGKGWWSHQGHTLAYVAPYNPMDASPAIEVHVRDVDANVDRVIATDHGSPTVPISWSPTDQFVAFGTFESMRSTLRVVSASASGGGFIVHGAWPGGWIDDRTMYFTGNVCGGFDIFTVHSDANGLRNFTQSPERDLYPASAPDGGSVAFTTVPGHVRLLSLADGRIRDIIASNTTLSTRRAATQTDEPWSPDGRFLVVGVEGGVGICEGAVPETTTAETSN